MLKTIKVAFWSMLCSPAAYNEGRKGGIDTKSKPFWDLVREIASLGWQTRETDLPAVLPDDHAYFDGVDWSNAIPSEIAIPKGFRDEFGVRVESIPVSAFLLKRGKKIKGMLAGNARWLACALLRLMDDADGVSRFNIPDEWMVFDASSMSAAEAREFAQMENTRNGVIPIRRIDQVLMLDAALKRGVCLDSTAKICKATTVATTNTSVVNFLASLVNLHNKRPETYDNVIKRFSTSENLLKSLNPAAAPSMFGSKTKPTPMDDASISEVLDLVQAGLIKSNVTKIEPEVIAAAREVKARVGSDKEALKDAIADQNVCSLSDLAEILSGRNATWAALGTALKTKVLRGQVSGILDRIDRGEAEDVSREYEAILEAKKS